MCVYFAMANCGLRILISRPCQPSLCSAGCIFRFWFLMLLLLSVLMFNVHSVGFICFSSDRKNCFVSSALDNMHQLVSMFRPCSKPWRLFGTNGRQGLELQSPDLEKDSAPEATCRGRLVSRKIKERAGE